jgi:hypothetical protein
MAEEVAEWSIMWGAKVKQPNDMPDDILKDAITYTRSVLEKCQDFEAEGGCNTAQLLSDVSFIPTSIVLWAFANRARRSVPEIMPCA